MENVIGSIPEFTPNEPEGAATPVNGETGSSEVKETVAEETAEPEKVTPAEPPTAETPSEPESEPAPADDTGKQVEGLLQEREKLLKEIQSLRGQRREIKQEQLLKVETKLEDLKDLNPDDINLIDRVLKAKGYLTKEESSKMFYEAVKQDELKRFLDKYPEYKPENDPNDLNWNALQRELAFYRMPDDPHLINEVLNRAHRAIVRTSDRTIPEKKQQLKVAGVGSGGVQRSSSRQALDAETIFRLKEGGFTDEDIQKMESRI